jgi:two-component system chemotaxis sensor kinase CheA
MTEKHAQVFIEEALELLADLEAALLELEDSPEDPELIGRIFRAMHTIKGSGAMFGFNAVSSFTHDIETVYDLIRKGKTKVTKALVDVSLTACDEIRKMIEAPDGGNVETDRTASLRGSFQRMAIEQESGKESSAVKGSESQSETEVAHEPLTYRIRFRPDKDIFKSGANPLLLLNELRSLGKCTVIAQTDTLPPLEELDPELCYTYWDIILTTEKGLNAIRDVFIFVEDGSELSITALDEEEVGATECKKLGEILVERGDLCEEDVKQVLGRQKRIGELLVDSSVVDSRKVASALAEQEHVKEVKRERQMRDAASSIRVPAEKLDHLVNMVGELVTIQSRMNQIASQLRDPALLQVVEEVERLISELRDNTMNIRMLPIGTTFSRFKRLVRDLSSELGKEIVLKTEGEETELDKTVIERLSDPLIHIIRNSIDHGIESPEMRESLGKSRQGTVRLSAFHSGANVVIEISDDGAGLNKDAIRRKAIDRGVLSPEAEISEKDLFSLVFGAGFSTADRVTGVSGRGVGMDVVKKKIEGLRGSVELSSKEGEGTTVTLKLPLTLAIIDGLMVTVGDADYIMPLASVEECIEFSRAGSGNSNGRNLVALRDRVVPYVTLREIFRVSGDAPPIQQIVISDVDGEKVGFVVDHVIGKHQTVIKALGKLYRDTEGLSGATILGDGSVALILELPKLVEIAGIDQRAAA